MCPTTMAIPVIWGTLKMNVHVCVEHLFVPKNSWTSHTVVLYHSCVAPHVWSQFVLELEFQVAHVTFKGLTVWFHVYFEIPFLLKAGTTFFTYIRPWALRWIHSQLKNITLHIYLKIYIKTNIPTPFYRLLVWYSIKQFRWILEKSHDIIPWESLSHYASKDSSSHLQEKRKIIYINKLWSI